MSFKECERCIYRMRGGLETPCRDCVITGTTEIPTHYDNGTPKSEKSDTQLRQERADHFREQGGPGSEAWAKTEEQGVEDIRKGNLIGTSRFFVAGIDIRLKGQNFDTKKTISLDELLEENRQLSKILEETKAFLNRTMKDFERLASKLKGFE